MSLNPSAASYPFPINVQSEPNHKAVVSSILEQAYCEKIMFLQNQIAHMKKKEWERETRDSRLTGANISLERVVKEKEDLLNRALSDVQSLVGQHDDLVGQHEELTAQHAQLKKDYHELLKRQVQLKASAAPTASQLSQAREEILALQKSQAELRVTLKRTDEVFVRHTEEIAGLKDERRKQEAENQYLRFENERLMRLLAEKLMPALVDLPEDCGRVPAPQAIQTSSRQDVRKPSALRVSSEESDAITVTEA